MPLSVWGVAGKKGERRVLGASKIFNAPNAPKNAGHGLWNGVCVGRANYLVFIGGLLFYSLAPLIISKKEEEKKKHNFLTFFFAIAVARCVLGAGRDPKRKEWMWTTLKRWRKPM